MEVFTNSAEASSEALAASPCLVSPPLVSQGHENRAAPSSVLFLQSCRNKSESPLPFLRKGSLWLIAHLIGRNSSLTSLIDSIYWTVDVIPMVQLASWKISNKSRGNNELVLFVNWKWPHLLRSPSLFPMLFPFFVCVLTRGHVKKWIQRQAAVCLLFSLRRMIMTPLLSNPGLLAWAAVRHRLARQSVCVCVFNNKDKTNQEAKRDDWSMPLCRRYTETHV